jgi:hypothetical protein
MLQYTKISNMQRLIKHKKSKNPGILNRATAFARRLPVLSAQDLLKLRKKYTFGNKAAISH